MLLSLKYHELFMYLEGKRNFSISFYRKGWRLAPWNIWYCDILSRDPTSFIVSIHIIHVSRRILIWFLLHNKRICLLAKIDTVFFQVFPQRIWQCEGGPGGLRLHRWQGLRAQISPLPGQVRILLPTQVHRKPCPYLALYTRSDTSSRWLSSGPLHKYRYRHCTSL